MQVVILAAGRGKRMGIYTDNTSKSMLVFGDEKKPMIAQIVDNCINVGLKDFVFVVGYKKEDIINYFKKNYVDKCNFKFIEQKNITEGTAKALECTKPLLNNKFILIYGDLVPTIIDIKNIYSFVSKDLNAMGYKQVEDPSRYGVIQISDNFELKKIIEKSSNPPSNNVNAGIYGFSNKSIFDFVEKVTLSARGEYELTDALQMFVNSGNKIFVYPVEPKDIGTKNDYELVLGIN